MNPFSLKDSTCSGVSPSVDVWFTVSVTLISFLLMHFPYRSAGPCRTVGNPELGVLSPERGPLPDLWDTRCAAADRYVALMRRFIVFSAGLLLTVLGSAFTGLAMGVWVFQYTGSATQYSLTLLINLLPMVLFGAV